jgi:hypothetical protein
VILAPMTLQIDRRDLTNRVNYDAVCPASPTSGNEWIICAALLDNSAWVLLGFTEHIVGVPLTLVLGLDFANTA